MSLGFQANRGWPTFLSTVIPTPPLRQRANFTIRRGPLPTTSHAFLYLHTLPTPLPHAV
ncbi:uncharacterized protein FOMMEDRAFT_162185 [Fomitiporia mediterranea MF3/22]|uniref:uncharacterized protein n=1 Tax=Fomitiporia mediterranea (strain MF3/22) TaxID=694068 RepID=UPI0004408D99|nr:uncharacterized protein FOMMEDRAFT_162185 [Fomitiporia mediterranea MF3/22]EJC97847.1 hypothetical protein FOMMEDRAFT_162185 [Fomitiporia mediterranea MF3/22]